MNQLRVMSCDCALSNATAGWKTLIPESLSFSKSFSVKLSGAPCHLSSRTQSSVSSPSMSMTFDFATRSMARVEHPAA